MAFFYENGLHLIYFGRIYGCLLYNFGFWYFCPPIDLPWAILLCSWGCIDLLSLLCLNEANRESALGVSKAFKKLSVKDFDLSLYADRYVLFAVFLWGVIFLFGI